MINSKLCGTPILGKFKHRCYCNTVLFSVHMKLHDELVFGFDYEFSDEPPFKIDQLCATREKEKYGTRLENIEHSCNTITGQLLKLE